MKAIMQEYNLNIFNTIDSKIAVSSKDGDKVFKIIQKLLVKKTKITIDFNNIQLITSSFLNSAIGQLYSEFKPTILKKYIKFKNISNEDKDLLKQVALHAEKFFKNKEIYNQNIKAALNNE